MNKCVTIIVTYNALKWVDKCLGSLQNSQLPTDVFVIDNTSSDNTVSHISEKFPKVEIFVQNENLGFGKANNVGLLEASKRNYQFFFLLNQDAWVEPNTIGNLISCLVERKELGVISPVHLNGSGNKPDWRFRHFIRNHIPNDTFLKRKGNPPEYLKVGFINAAAWMLTKACLEKVGLFHPLFFHYGEDSNFLARVRHKNFEVGVLSETFIYHDREDRGFNELKNAPKNAFQQFSLKILLHPINQSIGRKCWGEIIYKAIDIAFQKKVRGKVAFFIWALKKHAENIKLQKDFIKGGCQGLYLTGMD